MDDPEDLPEDLPDELLAALGDELIRIRRRRLQGVPGTTLDTSAYRILRVLDRTGPRTLRELAEDLQVEPSTISRQVNAAIRRGYLARTDADRAVRRILATEAGRDARRHDDELYAARFRMALERLGGVRARALVAELRAFNDALDDVAP